MTLTWRYAAAAATMWANATYRERVLAHLAFESRHAAHIRALLRNKVSCPRHPKVSLPFINGLEKWPSHSSSA